MLPSGPSGPGRPPGLPYPPRPSSTNAVFDLSGLPSDDSDDEVAVVGSTRAPDARGVKRSHSNSDSDVEVVGDLPPGPPSMGAPRPVFAAPAPPLLPVPARPPPPIPTPVLPAPSVTVPPPPPAPPLDNAGLLAKIECPVCLEATIELCSTICGHLFCKKCITGVVKTQSKCPVCRSKLTLKSFHRVFS